VAPHRPFGPREPHRWPSASAPAQLGDDAAAFEADLRRELLAANPSGIWTEDIRTEAIITTRP